MGHVQTFPTGGAGSTNNRNTVRRAFKDHETFAEILGIEKEVLR